MVPLQAEDASFNTHSVSEVKDNTRTMIRPSIRISMLS